MSIYKAKIEEGNTPVCWTLKDVQEISPDEVPEELRGALDEPVDDGCPSIYAGTASTEEAMYADLEAHAEGDEWSAENLVTPEGYAADTEAQVAYIKTDRDVEFLEGCRMFTV